MNFSINKKNIILPATLFLLLLIFDILTKYFIYNNIYVPIYITSFFNIDFVLNKGVSFGFLSNYGLDQYIFLVANILIVVTLYFLFAKQSIQSFYGWVLISCGAFGNAIDRGLYGGVVDFLDFHLIGTHFPSFNLADVYITCGIIYIIYIDFKNYLIKKYENQ